MILNRLKPLLNSLILYYQNTFTLVKSIQDNIIKAQELYQAIKITCHKSGLEGFKAALKTRHKWQLY